MVDITLRSAKGSPLTNAEVDGNFLALKAAVEAGGAAGYQEFTASNAAWPKPAGAGVFLVEPLSGAGSGAATYNSSSWAHGDGGAGGVARRKLFLASELPANIAIVCGAGGAAVSANDGSARVNGNPGGASSFHTFSVPGGRGGRGNRTASTPANNDMPILLSSAGVSSHSGENSASGGWQAVGGSSTYGGGGGGGTANAQLEYAGGTSQEAGAGGKGVRNAASGESVTAEAGAFPGGGGGAASVYGAGATATSGAGAAGRVRVWWW